MYAARRGHTCTTDSMILDRGRSSPHMRSEILLIDSRRSPRLGCQETTYPPGADIGRINRIITTVGGPSYSEASHESRTFGCQNPVPGRSDVAEGTPRTESGCLSAGEGEFR